MLKNNDEIQLLPGASQPSVSNKSGTSLFASSTSATANNSNVSFSQVNNNVRLVPNSTASCYQVNNVLLFKKKFFLGQFINGSISAQVVPKTFRKMYFLHTRSYYENIPRWDAHRFIKF